MDEIENGMQGLGDPRRLPPDLRERLAEQLGASEPLLEGLDGPRPLPAPMRDRLFTTLTSRRRRRLGWMNVAAALVLVAAITTVAVRQISHGATRGRSVTG